MRPMTRLFNHYDFSSCPRTVCGGQWLVWLDVFN